MPSKPTAKEKGDAAASPNEHLSTSYPQGEYTMNTSEQYIKTDLIVHMLNKRIRECLGQVGAEQICYSVAGWAEYWATEWYDTPMEEIDPKLAARLYRIKDAGGKLDGDGLRLAVDYGLLLPLDPPPEWKKPEGGE